MTDMDTYAVECDYVGEFDQSSHDTFDTYDSTFTNPRKKQGCNNMIAKQQHHYLE